jgi:hypothetical protein
MIGKITEFIEFAYPCTHYPIFHTTQFPNFSTT